MERIKNSLPELSITGKLIHEISGLETCEGYAIGRDAIVYSCKAHNMSGFYFKEEWFPIKSKPSPTGYLYVIFSGLDKRDYTCKIHKLMTLSFIPNNENLPIINHKDGNKLNNHVDNLEWCTYKHNARHCIEMGLRNTAFGTRMPNSILTDDDIPKIFELKKKGLINKDIASQFDIDISAVSRILNRKSWKHVPIEQP